MLRYPRATWDPLATDQTEDRMKAHDIACLHTMVGTLAGTSAMFHQNGYGGTESHFGLGGSGDVLQWQDCDHEADANFNGNYRVISMETADHGPEFSPWVDSNVPPWTAVQVDEIVRWLVWVTAAETHAGCPTTWTCHREGIPRELVQDSRPGLRGVAYHRQGIDPWRVSGGEVWSASTGKVCPGNARIDQLVRVVIPRVQAASTVIDHEELPEMFLYTAPGKPVFFCFSGRSVGLNEASDMPTFQAAKVPLLRLDDDTFGKFRQRFPGD